MEYVGDNKLIIYDTTLYTFGDRYLTAKHDARHFEINFRHKDGMLRFCTNHLHQNAIADTVLDARTLKHLFDESFRAMKRHSM